MSPAEQQLFAAPGSLIPLSQAAKLTPYSSEYLRLLVRKGSVKAIKIRRDWLTTEAAVLEYVEQQKERHHLYIEELSKPQTLKKQNAQAGFAPVKLFLVLGLAIVATSGFLVLITTGILPNKTLAQISAPTGLLSLGQALLGKTPEEYLAEDLADAPARSFALAKHRIEPGGPETPPRSTAPTSALADERASQQPQVLGESTSAGDLTALIANAIQAKLDQLLASGFLKGPKGDKGDSPAVIVPVNPGLANATESFYQPNQSQNFTGGSVQGVTQLSSNSFSTNDASVGNNLTVGGSASVQSLSVTGNSTFSGSTTIAGLTVTTLNPGLTLGSIAFQGASGLTQDNANFFYDATNHRLGIGTTTPANALTVVGNIWGNNFDFFQAAGSDGFNTFGGINAGNQTMSPAGGASNLASYNTAFGNNVFLANTTGYNNSAFGYNALVQNTTGFDNSAFGVDTLISNTTGYRNVAVGRRALKFNVGGHNNVALGFQTLQANTEGNENLAVGNSALSANTTGSQNVAVGGSTMVANVSGGSNVAVGYNVLGTNISGGFNTAVGTQVLTLSSTGDGNAGFGDECLTHNTTGAFNSCLGGEEALWSNTTGSYNNAFGTQALFFNTSGGLNTAIGHGSLYANTTGNTNVAVGDSAGAGIAGTGTVTTNGTTAVTGIGTHFLTDARVGGTITVGANNAGSYGETRTIATIISDTSLTTDAWTGSFTNQTYILGGNLTGSNNLWLGNSARPFTSNLTNAIGIGYNVLNTASNQVILGNSSITQTLLNGNVGIGSTSPTALTTIQGTSGSTTDLLNVASSTNTSLFIVKSSGNVGIGTTSPGASLDVSGGRIRVQGIGAAPTNGTGLELFYDPSFGISEILSYDRANSLYKTLTLDATTTIFNIGGSEKVRIDSKGNVGIGTTSPSATLQVYGTGGTNPFLISSSTGTGLMVIQQNGNVGIGTTTPSGVLSIVRSSAVNEFLYFTDYSNSGTGGFSFQRALGTQTSPLAIDGVRILGGVQGEGYNGSTFVQSSQIQFGAEGAFSTNNTPGNIMFNTLPAGGSLTERMRITSNGNVGIGTTSPIATLALTGTAGTNPLVIASSTGSTLLTVLQSGNVGIGTTSPTAGLHVGSAAAGLNVKIANGYLCVDNNDTCSGTNTAGGIYSVLAAATGADMAENYPTNDQSLEAGDVVAADTGFPVYVSKASSLNQSSNSGSGQATSPILGIVSTHPGFLLNGYKAQTFANASTVPVALAGRVPVKVSNENGNIHIGDYLTLSKQLPGYVMKANSAGFALGRALESFDSSSATSTILIFIQPMQYEPNVSDLLQTGVTDDNQTWLNSLVNLNMTNASVFGDLAVQGSLAVQKDLHVEGVIYAAQLNVDNITAKKVTTDQLCVDDVCVTRDQFLKMVQQSNGGNSNIQTNNNNGIVAPDSSATSGGLGSSGGQLAGTSSPDSNSGSSASGTVSPAPASSTPDAQN